MRPLFALLLTAVTIALPACADKSDADQAPQPAAETRMQRELRYPLTPSTPNGDTVLVLQSGYPAERIKATAMGPGALMSSYQGLQIVLEVPDQAEQVRLMVPATQLGAAWTGTHPFYLYSINQLGAGGAYLVGPAVARPLIDTYFSALGSGSVTISKYDARARQVSGSFVLRQISVSDPGALAGLPEPLRKKCTVAVTGTFVNLPVQ
ncbi:hypothetical protein [Hymenobacter chitinivorans]|uniref:Lipoprotein n=1 Tax=Hymenobacter chitinivorans DSM 11115 TaxID=1121954 RepID=A0A2M9B4N7_9BACT|nr:hypothetical protein [Hymenobacter chitinivorans]PJJ52904.1 hypothetical protein CLV45_3561 [Hymenobacter chitinivorans DSM 11115]